MEEAKKILLKILDIIDYGKDKNRFVNEFMDMCCRKTFTACISSLSPENKLSFDKDLKGVKEMDRCLLILQKYISQNDYQKKLETISRDTFIKYVDSVKKTLTDNQKIQLNTYLLSISR